MVRRLDPFKHRTVQDEQTKLLIPLIKMELLRRTDQTLRINASALTRALNAYEVAPTDYRRVKSLSMVFPLEFRRRIGLVGEQSHQAKVGRLAIRLRRYGLTVENYERMLAAQDGRCAICKTAIPTASGWCVDHDHARGPHAVRGVLCSLCNTGIGSLKDSPDAAFAAAEYLKKAANDTG